MLVNKPNVVRSDTRLDVLWYGTARRIEPGLLSSITSMWKETDVHRLQAVSSKQPTERVEAVGGFETVPHNGKGQYNCPITVPARIFIGP